MSRQAGKIGLPNGEIYDVDVRVFTPPFSRSGQIVCCQARALVLLGFTEPLE